MTPLVEIVEIIEIIGSLGFYFDGETLYIRSLIPAHGGGPSKQSWDEMQAAKKGRIARYYEQHPEKLRAKHRAYNAKRPSRRKEASPPAGS